jgi:hypothetical protein
MLTLLGSKGIIGSRLSGGSPSPERDVSLPSKSGLAGKSLAESAQFQYL